MFSAVHVVLIDEGKMGDYPMIENMQFVPGWTESHLINGMPLDIF